ncbi:HDOD domain-containing protein [Gammaproteobacteria bacterium]
MFKRPSEGFLVRSKNQRDPSEARKLPEPDDLRRFRMLQHLSTDQLLLLATRVPIQSVPAQTRLLKRGDSDPESILLLKGTLELVAADGRRQRVDTSSPSTQSPIAQLLPRRYDVICVTPVEYLRFDTQLLEGLREDKAREEDSNLIDIPASSGSTASSLDFLERLTADLEQDRFVPPTLPDVAMRLGRALEDQNADLKKVARLVQMDPAITAKLIKAANSPLYYRNQKIQSCLDAIMALGLDVTHKLVVSFVLRDLFRPSVKQLELRMQEVWSHSIRVASLCHVFARLTRKVPPERAMLAGLLHDIGVVAILAYAERCAALETKSSVLDGVITGMRATVGEMILKQWQFPEHTVTAAREAEDWMRDHDGPELDDCDLVIVSQIHSYMGTPKMQEIPAMDKIPAFRRLSFIDLSPKKSMKIIERADDEVAEMESLLKP